MLVADDHPLVHQSISALLGDIAWTIAIDAAFDAVMLWEACTRERYLLVLLDLRMPAMIRKGGIDGFQRDFPDQPTALLTAEIPDADIQKFRARGGRGVLLKSCDIQAMREALKVMLTEGCHFPGPRVERSQWQQQEPALSLERLSPRLRTVYDLLLLGLSNREIAAQLGLTVGTVKNYLHEVYRVLDVTSRAKVLHGALAARQPDSNGAGIPRNP
ncbi:response regulator transcription factor [soil metagenome]